VGPLLFYSPSFLEEFFSAPSFLEEFFSETASTEGSNLPHNLSPW